MSERGEQLYKEAERQIIAVAARLSALPDPARLNDPCPGREKLGDGTIAAVCLHVVGIFERIADFAESGRSDISGPQHHSPVAPVAIEVLLSRLKRVTGSLDVLRRLDGATLDAVPQEGAFRFADGERTLEQVLAGLLRHQNHQVDAVLAAL